MINDRKLDLHKQDTAGCQAEPFGEAESFGETESFGEAESFSEAELSGEASAKPRPASWYVMRTIPGKEEEALKLLEQKVSHSLWDVSRILRKRQLYRIRGQYIQDTKDMFPGYLFIRTDSPAKLAEELQKARLFPQLIGNPDTEIVAVEENDLSFLQNACGKDLEHDMELSTVEVDEEGQITGANGALAPYVDRVTRQRLRHRFVVAKVALFNREEDVLFGVKLQRDEIRNQWELPV